MTGCAVATDCKPADENTRMPDGSRPMRPIKTQDRNAILCTPQTVERCARARACSCPAGCRRHRASPVPPPTAPRPKAAPRHAVAAIEAEPDRQSGSWDRPAAAMAAAKAVPSALAAVRGGPYCPAKDAPAAAWKPGPAVACPRTCHCCAAISAAC